MRLPDKDDPGGDREGSLPRDIVLSVLREHDVSIEEQSFKPFYLLSASDIIEAHPLDDMVGGLLIRQLSRQFGIDITAFYWDPTTGLRRV